MIHDYTGRYVFAMDLSLIDVPVQTPRTDHDSPLTLIMYAATANGYRHLPYRQCDADGCGIIVAATVVQQVAYIGFDMGVGTLNKQANNGGLLRSGWKGSIQCEMFGIPAP